MASRNSGPALTSKFKGSVDNIPPEFKSKLGTTVVTQKDPKETEPSPLTITLIESKTERTVTGELLKTDISLTEPITLTLITHIRTPDGQDGTVTRRLVAEGTGITPTALTVDITQRNLGNGLTDESITTVDSVFGENVYGSERPDVIPQEFRAAVPITTTSSVSAGTASAPTLATGDLSRQEQQTTVQKKRVSRSTRASTSLPVTLGGSILTDDGQVGTVAKTLDAIGNLSITPSALIINSRITALGDGNAVKEETTVATVFPASTYSAERPDLTPQQFKGIIPTLQTSAVTAGTAAAPSLATGEISKTEEQLTVHRKKTTTASRSAASLPATLTETELSPQGQTITIVKTLESGVQAAVTPAATTVLGKVDIIGDGTSLKTVGTVSSVFAETIHEAERPDRTPDEFRALIPATSLSEVSAGTAAAPTLGTGDISASEEQITEQKKRTRRTTRAAAELPAELVESILTPDGQVGTLTKTLDEAGNLSITAGALVINSRITLLGDGNAVKEETTVASVFGANTFSADRPDLTPQQFQGIIPTVETSVITAGAAAAISLTTGQISKSEEQITADKKRTRIRTRAAASLPATITETRLTDEGQTMTVTKTLDTGVQSAVAPSATTVLGQVDVIGDGTSLKTTGTVASVFGANVYEAEVADRTPEEFRASIPAITTTATSAGTAVTPTLAAGDISKREEQVTADKKRTSTTTRTAASLPVELVESVLTPDGQLGTVTRTLNVADSLSITPGALVINSKITLLGDGNAVKEETTVATVFGANTYSADRPDLTPQQFKGIIPTMETSVTTAGTAAAPSLTTGQLSKREEQVTADKKRTTTASRSAASLPATLTETRLTEEGQTMTVVKTLDAGVQGAVTPSATTLIGQVDIVGDGTSLRTVGTVDSVFSAASFEAERPDPTPEEFRVLIPAITTTQTEAGTAAAPTLDAGDLSKREEQVSTTKKRTSTTTRSATALPAELVDTVLTAEGQVGTVTKTLDEAANLSITPSALVISSRITLLGDGNAVKEETTVETVFAENTFAKDRPDPTPEAFRVLIPAITTSSVSSGTAAAPTLSAGDLSAREEQLTVHKKRTTRTTRAAASLPATLVGSVLTPDGQVGTRTQTLDVLANLSITAGALVIASSITNLGDGNALKDQTVVGSVFGAAAYTAIKEDFTPTKFKTEEIRSSTATTSAGTAAAPTLTGIQSQATQTQVNASIKRIEIEERAISTNDTLTGSRLIDGLNAAVTETMGAGLTFTAEHGVMDAEVINVGGGIQVRTVAAVTTPMPILEGQEYDSRYDMLIPFTEQITDTDGTGLGDPYTTVTPIDAINQRVRVIDPPTDDLDAYFVSYPTNTSINFPKILNACPITWETTTGVGEDNQSGSGGSVGRSATLSLACNASAQSSAAIIPDIQPEIIEVWGEDLPTTDCYFFLPNTVSDPLTQTAVLTKLTAKLGAAVLPWPIWKPKAHTITLKGVRISLSCKSSVQQYVHLADDNASATQGSGEGYSKEMGLTVKTIRIPACLHGTISIGTTQTLDIEVNSLAEMAGGTNWTALSQSAHADDTLEASVTPNSLAATEPAALPEIGLYLLRLDVDAYQFGYSIVRAKVFDFANLAP